MRTIQNGTAWKGASLDLASLAIVAEAIKDAKAIYLDAMNGDQTSARALDRLALKIAARLDAEGKNGLSFLAHCNPNKN
jgi:hypothetical protein